MTYSDDLVKRVLCIYYNNKPLLNTLANTFMVSIKTIYNWRCQHEENLFIGKNYCNTNNIILNKRNKYKRTSKLTDDLKSYILTYVNGNYNLTGKRMIKHLQRKFGIIVKLSTIYKWFKILKITYKKVNIRKTFVHKKKEKLINILKEKINDVPDNENIVSIDESHFQINMQQTHSWASSKTKIYRQTYNKRKDGVSLIMAVNKKKVIGFKIINGSVDRYIFKDFIESIYKDGHVYLMDNARIHHAKVLKEYIEKSRASIIYNVAYNPETNPIEKVFNTLKSNIVNYNTQTIPKLYKAIERAIKKVTSDHLKNYFNKSLNVD